MKNLIIVLFLSILVSLGVWVWQKSPEDSKDGKDIKNISYVVDGETVTLMNGGSASASALSWGISFFRM